MNFKILILFLFFIELSFCKKFPIVVNTWDFTNATIKAFEVLNQKGKTVIDAVVEGCTICEEQQCDGSVGWGGSPNEEGETTLDAMVMDGKTMKVGAVGGLRYIKDAIAVARHVFQYTKHTLLVGDQATEFAVKMGFEKQNLSMTNINEFMDDWKNKSCQPNYWMNVLDSEHKCGPYEKNENIAGNEIKVTLVDNRNHDTIGMIAIDEDGNIAVGTSTNGLTYKLPGRVGDTPIVGSGGYADNKVGGAAATGDGDVMMRFSASFLAVELMRNGKTPQEAADLVIARIAEYFPDSIAAIVVLDKDGNYGSACQIFESFPISIYNPELDKVKIEDTKCRQINEQITTTTGAAFRIYVNKFSLCKKFPIVVNTWDFTNSTIKAFEVLNQKGKTAIDAVVEGCAICEEQCEGSVGWGGSPNEEGETTLDAMVMDGKTMKVGAVGGLRYIKDAIAVARHVFQYTKHTLLVGDQATEFAVKMGFEKQNLSMTNINEYMDDWKNKSCQPNNWINVHPDPSKNCGPYTKNENIADNEVKVNIIDEKNHDTIGMIAIDEDGNIAVGTSTNGMTYKIPGRVGDSPIPGSGGYADNKVGGAAATGDGDVMMRFSASFLAVELMRNGKTPQEAAELVIARIGEFYPESSAAIVVLDKDGNYGFACQIFSYFSISIYHPELDKVKIEETKCRQIGDPITTTTSAAFRIHFNSIILFFITFLLGMI